MGWNEIWTPHCTNLRKFVKLTADGKSIELPGDTEGLIFCNITSFGGGMKLWDDTNSSFPSFPTDVLSKYTDAFDVIANGNS